MVFLLGLSDSKSPQVSGTFLSILADLNNAVVWIVPTRPLISKWTRPCTNSLVTILSSPITIGNTVTFIFHCFFSSLARSRYLSLFSLSFSFYLWSAGTVKFAIPQVLLLFFFCFEIFFTQAQAGGFSLGFEWQQVSSSLQDSSQYSGQSQQCCSSDSLQPSSYFQILQSLYQSFGDYTKSTNYNWYFRHFHLPQFFDSLSTSRYSSLFPHSFNNTL